MEKPNRNNDLVQREQSARGPNRIGLSKAAALNLSSVEGANGMSKSHKKISDLMKQFDAIIAHNKTLERKGTFYPLPLCSTEELRHLAALASVRKCGTGVFYASLKVFVSSCADELRELYGDEFLDPLPDQKRK
jgi:hypothetical protein